MTPGVVRLDHRAHSEKAGSAVDAIGVHQDHVDVDELPVTVDRDHRRAGAHGGQSLGDIRPFVDPVVPDRDDDIALFEPGHDCRCGHGVVPHFRLFDDLSDHRLRLRDTVGEHDPVEQEKCDEEVHAHPGQHDHALLPELLLPVGAAHIGG